MANSSDNTQIKDCPLCGSGSRNVTFDFDTSAECYDCSYCGSFKASKMFVLAQRPANHLISGVMREYWEQHGERLLITTENVDDLEQLAPGDRDVREKSRRLLLALANKTEHPGGKVGLNLNLDYPLAYCRTSEELEYYLDHLEEEGLIRSPGNHEWCYIITAKGWERIESYKASNAESSKVFVAMWFDGEMDQVYEEGIKPAIEDDCGFKAIKINLKEFVGDIVDEIIAEIRESRFIVADFTGQRQGVYYEAGFAHGLGLPVVLTCRKDQVKKLHFDTNHQNHIDWETPEELRERLANRIRAVIGLGPNKTP